MKAPKKSKAIGRSIWQDRNMRESHLAGRSGAPPKKNRKANAGWKAGVAVVLLALVAALAAVAVGVGTIALDIYRSYNALRRDPLGILRAEKAPAGPYDVLLIGDSLAEGWRIEGCAVANMGISGQTSGQVLHRMQLMDEGIRARAAILFVGGNDLKTLRAEPEMAAKVVDECLTNLREILRLAKSRSEKVFVATVPPINEVPWYWKAIPSTKAILRGIESLNEGIRELAAEEGAAAIDCERAFRGMAAEEVVAQDKAHLSENAYQALMVEIMSNKGWGCAQGPATERPGKNPNIFEDSCKVFAGGAGEKDGIPILSREQTEIHLAEMKEAAYADGKLDVEALKAFIQRHPRKNDQVYWNGTAYPPASLGRLFALACSGDMTAEEHAELTDWMRENLKDR